MDSGWGLRGGVLSGRSPFWRKPKESCKGLGSATLKINTQHTLRLSEGVGYDTGGERDSPSQRTRRTRTRRHCTPLN